MIEENEDVKRKDTKHRLITYSKRCLGKCRMEVYVCYFSKKILLQRSRTNEINAFIVDKGGIQMKQITIIDI